MLQCFNFTHWPYLHKLANDYTHAGVHAHTHIHTYTYMHIKFMKVLTWNIHFNEYTIAYV